MEIKFGSIGEFVGSQTHNNTEKDCSERKTMAIPGLGNLAVAFIEPSISMRYARLLVI